MRTAIDQYHDIYATKYARHWDEGLGYNPPIARHLHAYDLIRIVRGVRTVLDVGCGAGQLLRLLDAAGYDATGTEVTDVLFERQLIGLHVVVDWLPRLSPFNDKFDAICVIDVLEHLDTENDVRSSIERLHQLTNRYLLTEIGFGSCIKCGEELHHIQQQWPWWYEKISPRFMDVMKRGQVVLWTKR